MDDEDFWVPLVEEPLGDVVSGILAEDSELAELVASPKRHLTFRTFAYVRVGMLLGQLLMDRDVDASGSETWVHHLLEDPEVLAAVTLEVREVAREVANDPALADTEPVGPDDDALERFRRFARGV